MIRLVDVGNFLSPLKVPAALLAVASLPLAPNVQLLYAVVMVAVVLMLAQRYVSSWEMRLHEQRERADRSDMIERVLATGRSFDAAADRLARDVKAVHDDVRAVRSELAAERTERETLARDLREVRDNPLVRAAVARVTAGAAKPR